MVERFKKLLPLLPAIESSRWFPVWFRFMGSGWWWFLRGLLWLWGYSGRFRCWSRFLLAIILVPKRTRVMKSRLNFLYHLMIGSSICYRNLAASKRNKRSYWKMKLLNKNKLIGGRENSTECEWALLCLVLVSKPSITLELPKIKK